MQGAHLWSACRYSSVRIIIGNTISCSYTCGLKPIITINCYIERQMAAPTETSPHSRLFASIFCVILATYNRKSHVKYYLRYIVCPQEIIFCVALKASLKLRVPVWCFSALASSHCYVTAYTFTIKGLCYFDASVALIFSNLIHVANGFCRFKEKHVYFSLWHILDAGFGL